MIETAIAYAHEHFEKCNVKRKYTGEDYIIHPIRVMLIVRSVEHNLQMLTAAILHDTLEDCPSTNIHEINTIFGLEVARLVMDLTDVARPEDGNRAARNKINFNHIVHAHPEAKTIKLADLIDNTKDIVNRDIKFAKVYLKEKEMVLAGLRNASSPKLLRMARTVLEEAKNRLEVSE